MLDATVARIVEKMEEAAYATNGVVFAKFCYLLNYMTEILKKYIRMKRIADDRTTWIMTMAGCDQSKYY